jgi:hypothetical protein
MSKARDIASAAPAPSTVSATELGYVDGVTSAIQTQLDAKTAKSTLTTTGDIYYASAANTPARLGIGSTGNVLTVASGIPSWAAPAGGGKVLQVVNATYATETTNSTTTFADTGLTASITPTSATSKILVIVTQQGIFKENGNSNNSLKLKLLRGASTILEMADSNAFTGAATFNTVGSVSASYLDSPATTSSTTYKTQFANNVAAVGVTVQRYQTVANLAVSTITLLEIGA